MDRAAPWASEACGAAPDSEDVHPAPAFLPAMKALYRLAPLLLLAPLAPAPAHAGGPAQICPHLARNFALKAQLPAGALAVLFPMAERGRPFQVSDAIRPGPRLPFSRFVSARQAGCTLAVRYEYGGRAHGFATATLEQRGRAWVLVRQR
jgi:hypothetical protein